MGLVYIYISIVALSAEAIYGVGIGIPIAPGYTLSDDEYSIKADSAKGIQAVMKSRYIDDFNDIFCFAVDLDLGNSNLDNKMFCLNADIGAGVAIGNIDKFVFIPSIMVGIDFRNKKMSDIDDYGPFTYRVQAILFEVGADLYANYWFTDFVGMFLSCKIMYQIGQMRMRYEGENYRIGRMSGFNIKPSVGVSFTF